MVGIDVFIAVRAGSAGSEVKRWFIESNQAAGEHIYSLQTELKRNAKITQNDSISRLASAAPNLGARVFCIENTMFR